MQLNAEQEVVVSFRDGSAICVAIPGSGKTRVITQRVARMVKEGIWPASIMCITFTNKAADEMRSRISQEVGESAEEIQISTFHSLCSKILRASGHKLGYTKSFSILDDGEQVDLMAQIARQMEYNFPKPLIKQILWQVNDSREELEDEKSFRNRFAVNPERFKVAQEYLKRLLATNCIDFSGLLTETVKLLENHKDVLESLQNRFKWLMIDESQDTNTAQMRFIELIGDKYKNVVLVGDLDQCLYKFRGAKPENIKKFQNKFPNVQVFKLSTNYRSTPEILAAAKKLIEYNPNRFKVDFHTDNPSGPPIQHRSFDTESLESDCVANKCLEAINKGIKPNDIAVLFRLNSMSRSIEMALRSKGIPYSIKGAFSFFDRREVKDLLSMLKFLVNPKDGIAFHRIANKPTRGLGNVAVGKIENFAIQNNIDILEACKRVGEYTKSKAIKDGVTELYNAFASEKDCTEVSATMSRLFKALKYDEYIKEEPDTQSDRMDNIEELITRDAIEFEQRTNGNISQYLEKVTLAPSEDDEDKQGVALSSIHSAKGLEFHTVFIIGAEDGILPHKRAVEESEDGIESERMCAFVAVTRCKRDLFITWTKFRNTWNGRIKCTPSQFLWEMGLTKKVEKVSHSDYDSLQEY